MKLKDRVAIVTGAAQGIGRAYAHRLAKEGATVVVADINKKAAELVSQEIEEFGGNSISCHVNVMDEKSINDMVSYVDKTYGKIEILINNAAVFSTIKMKPIEDIDIDEWDLIQNVNVKGVFLCCKSVLPIMKRNKYGRIINISSSAVYLGRPYYIHYVTSKAGILGFTGALSREVGEYGITVNSITPGPTTTEIPRETVTENQKKEMLNRQSIKREQIPTDLTGIVTFLCSEEAEFITGQTFNIDGGMTIRI